MRYCYNCDRTTVGQPIFCNFCGRTYNVKLCPKLHPNPRSAEVCHRCGSRELSTPQPRIPLWVHITLFVLTLLPGVALALVSIAVIRVLIQQLRSGPDLPAGPFLLTVLTTFLWFMWAEFPHWIRSAIHKWLKRKHS